MAGDGSQGKCDIVAQIDGANISTTRTLFYTSQDISNIETRNYQGGGGWARTAAAIFRPSSETHTLTIRLSCNLEGGVLVSRVDDISLVKLCDDDGEVSTCDSSKPRSCVSKRNAVQNNNFDQGYDFLYQIPNHKLDSEIPP